MFYGIEKVCLISNVVISFNIEVLEMLWKRIEKIIRVQEQKILIIDCIKGNIYERYLDLLLNMWRKFLGLCYFDLDICI